MNADFSQFQTLENLIRKVQFGTIYDLHIADGVVEATHNPRVCYTRKPRPRGRSSGDTTDTKAGSVVLFDAMQDLRRDIEDLRGSWTVAIKVANGVPLSWDREPIGSS